MIGCIICGHGNYSEGMYDALHKIVGDLTDIVTVSFDVQQQEDVLVGQLEKMIKTMSDMDRIIIACDLCNGTPFKMGVMLSLKYSNIEVVGGINLAFLIELAVKKSYDPRLSLKMLCNEAKTQISVFDCRQEEENTDED